MKVKKIIKKIRKKQINLYHLILYRVMEDLEGKLLKGIMYTHMMNLIQGKVIKLYNSKIQYSKIY